MAQLPNVYSLLGQATTAEYRRRREEERKYYKDLKKEQMKAALLQPLIGAAATTGMQAVTGLAADFFLPEKGASFADTEAGRALGVQLSNINAQKKQLQEELDFYNTPDAPTKMAEIIYKDSLAGMGAVGDEDKKILRQLVYADKDTISRELDSYRSALKKQLALLSTAPSAEEVASRLKDTRYYYGKSKLQKLFSTGFNKIFGKDMDEVRQRSRNFLITGSEDPNYKTAIFDSMSSSKAFQELMANSEQLIKGDDRLLERALQRLKTEPDSRDLYAALMAKGRNEAESLLNTEVFFTGIINKYSDAQAEAEENGTINPFANTLGYKIFISPEFEKFRLEGDIKGFKDAVVKNIFPETFKEFKTQALATSKEIGKARSIIQEELDDLNTDLVRKIEQQDAYATSILNGAFSEAERTVNNLATDNPAFANYTPNEIKAGVRRYVAQRASEYETLDSETVPLVLKELTLEQQEQLMMASIADIRSDSTRNAELEATRSQTRAKLNSKLEELIPRIENDETIQNKYAVAKEEMSQILDNFKKEVEKGVFTQEEFEIFETEMQQTMGTLETTFAPLPLPDPSAEDYAESRRLTDRAPAQLNSVEDFFNFINGLALDAFDNEEEKAQNNSQALENQAELENIQDSAEINIGGTPQTLTFNNGKVTLSPRKVNRGESKVRDTTINDIPEGPLKTYLLSKRQELLLAIGKKEKLAEEEVEGQATKIAAENQKIENLLNTINPMTQSLLGSRLLGTSQYIRQSRMDFFFPPEKAGSLDRMVNFMGQRTSDNLEAEKITPAEREKFIEESLSIKDSDRSLLEKPEDTKTVPETVEDKVEFVGNILGDNDRQIEFMKRVVNQESLFGKAPGTYEPGGDAGVAQVNRVAFDQVMKKLTSRTNRLSKVVDPFKAATGIDLTKVQFEDLNDNDLLSIAFGRMYLRQRTGAGIPKSLRGQAEYWKKYYNTSLGAGTIEKFIATNKSRA